jgi:hypothetical protein
MRRFRPRRWPMDDCAQLALQIAVPLRARSFEFHLKCPTLPASHRLRCRQPQATMIGASGYLAHQARRGTPRLPAHLGDAASVVSARAVHLSSLAFGYGVVALAAREPEPHGYRRSGFPSPQSQYVVLQKQKRPERCPAACKLASAKFYLLRASMHLPPLRYMNAPLQPPWLIAMCWRRARA